MEQRGEWTHDVWMIETLGHPISLHTLSSFPLTFFFGMAFSATSCVTSPGLGGGMSHIHEGERGSGERVGRGGG
jgi:hypothetical protein